MAHIMNNLPSCSGTGEKKLIVAEKEKSVSMAKDLPDTICINTSSDFEIGEELEISSVSDEEQERKVDRGSTSVASWLTRNLVGITSPHADPEVVITKNESENTPVHEVPQRVTRRFERDTESLRIQVLIAATRRRMESYFNTSRI